MEIQKETVSNNLLQWRNILETNKKRILATEESLKRHAKEELSAEGMGELTKAPLHAADLASNTQELATLETLSEKNIKSIQEIDYAIARVDNGTYGLCLSCGERIALERLKSVPEARFCIGCQEELENIQKTSTSKQFAINVVAAKNLLQEGLEALGKIAVGDIMQVNPITVKADDSLNVAAELLAAHKIRHLPVIDDVGDIQGIISDRDLLGVVLRIGPWKNARQLEDPWIKTRVCEVMTKTPETIISEIDIFEAGAILLENKISCLPVVEGTQLVGIITESDFVKLVCQSL
jgi:RNA polymerase-binding protein DksA